MAVKLTPRAAPGKTGPKRTKPAPTLPTVMKQTNADMDDKWIASSIAITKVKGTWNTVKEEIGPSAGAEAMGAMEAEGEKRAAGARQKPPFFTPDVGPGLLSRVIITRLAAPMGVDPKKVRTMVSDGFFTKGSPIGTVGDTIHINSEFDPQTGQGQEALAHELAHVRQNLGQGKKDLPAAETEAGMMARAAVYNQPVTPPKFAPPANEIAAFTPLGAGPPDTVTLNVNGALINVPTPGTIEKEVTVDVPNPGIPGFEPKTARLKFDETWNIETGMLSAAVQTPFLTWANAQMEITPGGGVKIDIPTVSLRVGEVAYGAMDVIVTPEGVTGDAEVDFSKIKLGMGLEIAEGTAWLHNTPAQEIKGMAKLKGMADGFGPFQLALKLANTEPSGEFGAHTTAPLDLAPGVVLQQGVASAEFNKQGFIMKGGANVQVLDWANGDLAAEYKYPGGPWTVAGTLNQQGERNFGDLTVTNAGLGLVVQAGSLQAIKGQGHFTVPHFQGNFGGTYEVAPDAFTADGTVQMTEEIDFGNGTILKSVDGTLKMEANTLIEAEAKMTGEFSYEEEPSFFAELEGKHLFPEEKFSGEGKFKTIRDIRFGPENAYNVVVSEGSEAETTITDNLIEKASSMWEFAVNDAEGEIGKGSAEFKYDGTTFEGSGKFELTMDVGYPDRQAGPVQLLTGTSAEVTFENSVITSIKIGNGGIHVKSETAQGEIEGTFEGEVHPEDMIVIKADGMAEQQTPVKLVQDKIEVTAAGVNVLIENDVLMESSGSISMAVDAVGGLEGSGEFKWDKIEGPDRYDFDGVIKYVITDEIQGEIDVLFEAGAFSIEGTPVDTVEKLDELAELVKRVLDVVSISAAIAPFSLEMIPTYLAYRIWVLKNLEISQIGQVLKDVWKEINGGFEWLLEFLPQWMRDAWGWFEGGAPNVLEDMSEWLSENLQALGQIAVDWLGGMGEWGADTIRGAGAWAVEAAGWAMEAISDAGEALGSAAEAAWDWLT